MTSPFFSSGDGSTSREGSASFRGVSPAKSDSSFPDVDDIGLPTSAKKRPKIAEALKQTAKGSNGLVDLEVGGVGGDTSSDSDSDGGWVVPESEKEKRKKQQQKDKQKAEAARKSGGAMAPLICDDSDDDDGAIRVESSHVRRSAAEAAKVRRQRRKEQQQKKGGGGGARGASKGQVKGQARGNGKARGGPSSKKRRRGGGGGGGESDDSNVVDDDEGIEYDEDRDSSGEGEGVLGSEEETEESSGEESPDLASDDDDSDGDEAGRGSKSKSKGKSKGKSSSSKSSSNGKEQAGKAGRQVARPAAPVQVAGGSAGGDAKKRRVITTSSDEEESDGDVEVTISKVTKPLIDLTGSEGGSEGVIRSGRGGARGQGNRRSSSSSSSSSESSHGSNGSTRKRGAEDQQRQQRQQERQQRQRQRKREEAAAAKRQQEEEEEEEEELVTRDSDSGGEDGYGSEEDEDVVARRVLAKCKKVSAQISDVITSWQGGEGDDALAEGLQDGALDMTEVSESLKREKRAVSEADVKEVCPGLCLKPYQLVGVNWMWILHNKTVNGVLADEMGLGKTVQTIAFFGYLKLLRDRGTHIPGDEHSLGKAYSNRPHIVVVPGSVLTNWENELSKFCPMLDVLVYHGSQTQRAKLKQDLILCIKKKKDFPDVILSTYSLWQTEGNREEHAVLRHVPFDYLVLDEGHSIKNAKSNRYRKMCAIKSAHRLLLSGTPVQNDVGELLTLLTFLMSGIFKESVRESLLGFVNGNGEEALREVRGMMAPFVLRRIKAQVLDLLPPKIQEVVTVDLQPMQRKVYDSIIAKHLKRKEEASKSKTRLSKESKGAKRVISQLANRKVSPTEQKHIFTALRKAANHPLLLQHYFTEEQVDEVSVKLQQARYFGAQASLEQVRTELKDYSDFDLHNVCVSFPSLEHLGLEEDSLFNSAKMAKLKVLLPKLREEKHRVLLFSQWTKLLDILQMFLTNVLKWRFCRLDGQTSIEDRQALINEFNADEDIPIFLLSTRAGGMGINLTAADTVILHDLDFNPQVDRQAEDRCHRIGQERPVTVYKLVSEGTVDRDIFNIAERKKGFTETLLEDADVGGASSSSSAADSISSVLAKAIAEYQQQKPSLSREVDP